MNPGTLRHTARQIAAITVKEIKVILSDREALLLLFVMPLFFIVVMSFALQSVFEAGSRERPFRILAVDSDGGSLAAGVIADLKRMEGLVLIETADGRPITREKADRMIRQGDSSLAVVFEKRFTELALQIKPPADEKAVVYLVSDPATHTHLLNSLSAVIRSAIERRILLASIPELLSKSVSGFAAAIQFDTAPMSRQMEKRLADMLGDAQAAGGASTVRFVHASPAGILNERRPTATEQNVPAYTIFGVFFIVLTLAGGFRREREDGTFQRIMAAPLSKAAFLTGKLLPYYVVNLVQIALMFSVGVLFFGLKTGNVPSIIMVSLALAASANGLGLLVAAIGKTEAQVNTLSVLLAITLAALGGMMVPVFLMPGFMKTLSLLTPHAWALSGYHDIMIRGLSFKDVLTETGCLFGFAASFFAFALWRFRF